MSKKLFLFSLIIHCCSTYAQTLFHKTLGGTGDDTGYSVQIAHDGNYLLLGSTSNAGAGNKDILLLKTHRDGTIIWSKTFGGAAEDYPSCIIRTNNNGYAIIGITRSFGAGNKDIYLLKLDENGNVEWSKSYGGNAEERGLVMHQTFDNGYIIAGSTMSYGAGGKDIYVIKVNESGDMEWNVVMGGYLDDTNLDIKPIGDGYILGNAVSSYGIGGYDFSVIKLDLSGNMLWSKNIGGVADDNPTTIHQTADGNMIIGGHTRSWGVGNWDIMLTKLDSNGNLIWNKIYGAANYDFIRQMISLRDGNYLIFGYSPSFGFGNDDIYLAKMTPMGNITWSKVYGNTQQDWNPFHGTIPVVEDSEGSLIFTGEINTSSNRDIYFVKTDATGYSGNCNEMAYQYTATNALPTIQITTPNIANGGNVAIANTIQGTYAIPETVICITSPIAPPTAQFTASQTHICAGDCISFTDLSTGQPTQWQWILEGASPASSNQQNPSNICYPTSGIYSVTLIASNNALSDTLLWSNYIEVYPSHSTTIDTTLYEGETLQINGNSYNQAGTYTQALTASNGCDSTLLIQLNLIAPPPINCDDNNPNTIDTYNSETNTCQHQPIGTPTTLLIPNAFSPNQDGMNDYLNIISNNEGISHFHLSIYNRWGQKVFESNSIEKSWDGKYKNIAQEIGIYAYIVSYAINGETQPLKTGNITLIR